MKMNGYLVFSISKKKRKRFCTLVKRTKADENV